MVLWSLVLMGFLAGEYLEHNRGKASLANTAWDSLRQKEAVDSVLHLFAGDFQPIPGEDDKFGTWTAFSPGEIDLWVRVDNESNRININEAPDSLIRDKILALLGQERADEADQLTDAILDWRDADTLVRTNGAEADVYDSLGLSYGPANGPFKVLTELLLVRGMTPRVFWGNPLTGLLSDGGEASELAPVSLVDEITIYPDNVKRVSILVPGKQKGYTFIIAFLEKKEGQWEVLQLYRSMLTTFAGETRPLDRNSLAF